MVRQATGAAVGLVALVVCARIPYRTWEKMAWPIVWFTIALLVIIILPGTEAIAPEIKGARRWLKLGITIQPSEFAKVSMVIWTAMMAVKKQDQFSTACPRGSLPSWSSGACS